MWVIYRTMYQLEPTLWKHALLPHFTETLFHFTAGVIVEYVVIPSCFLQIVYIKITTQNIMDNNYMTSISLVPKDILYKAHKTETHQKMHMGEVTATIRKHQHTLQTGVSLMHKLAYPILKQFLGLLPKPQHPANGIFWLSLTV